MIFDLMPEPGVSKAEREKMRADQKAWRKGQFGWGNMITSFPDSLKADMIAKTEFANATQRLLDEHHRQEEMLEEKAVDVVANMIAGDQTIGTQRGGK